MKRYGVVKDQLRRIPQRGIGYGLLRYLGDQDSVQQLQNAPQPDISFNYLGQIGSFGSTLLGWSQESSGPARSPAMLRRHALELNGFITDGRLHLAWTYGATLHRQATIERLAERFTAVLRAIIAQAREQGAHGFTPMDFPQARLNQQQLDAFLARLEETQQ